jgi:hypothetical protein
VQSLIEMDIGVGMNSATNLRVMKCEGSDFTLLCSLNKLAWYISCLLSETSGSHYSGHNKSMSLSLFMLVSLALMSNGGDFMG